MLMNTSLFSRHGLARVSLTLLLLLAQCNLFIAGALAQTKPVPTQQVQGAAGNSQVPAPDGLQTQNTVPQPYDDAVSGMYAINKAVSINQNYINTDVNRILSGEYVPNAFQPEMTTLALQSAEQGQGSSIQYAAHNILNSSLGSVNEFYRGMTQWWKDSIVGNLFQNIGQLNGKWLSEFTGGWVADTAQFLAKFLSVFVLNPNVAVNGLGNNPSDGISPYIREGADIMYGIAVDLLLLLFILCIWKYWADASWGGAGNLMAPVGRLIFTSGLLLAWPTIYAFEIQVSNEMIRAVYANNPEQVMMLDYALGQVVKGGVIAAGAGAFSVLAPVLGKVAMPVGGELVGNVFYFASTLVFTILGGIIIAEIVYILILKAIQTALLTAQYMFAPIFLVFFATPDTESYATGYVRAFVETSLWTFVWVGLLKIMTIILFSDFNPWGKALISIGVLQLMIQVPSFIGRAQISPVSDFISAGLVFGTFNKALTGLRDMTTSLASKGVDWFTGDNIANKGMQQSTSVGVTALAAHAKSPDLLNSLNKVSQAERVRASESVGSDHHILAQGPGLKMPLTQNNIENGAESTKQAEHEKNLQSILGPGRKILTPDSSSNGGHQNRNSKGISSNTAVAADMPPGRAILAGLRSRTINSSFGLAAMAASGLPSGSSTANVPPLQAGSHISALEQPSTESSVAMRLNSLLHNGVGAGANDHTSAVALNQAAGTVAARTFNAAGPTGNSVFPGSVQRPSKERFEWARSSAHDWNEANLVHVDTRKLLNKLTSVNGVGLRTGQSGNSILGSTANGVQRVNIADGANDTEMTHAIYSAAFANNVAYDDPAKDAARQAAMECKMQEPEGILQNMCANWLSNTGSSWTKTAAAKQRFQHTMFEKAVQGSQDYLSRRPGNAYTAYLRARYGEWDGAQEAEAIHLISNPDSSESPWNRNIGPATEMLVASGIPIDKDTRGAMQNASIQAMHPARRKQAVFAALSYTYPQAKSLYGDEHSAVFKLAHGEMARALPADEINNALSMYHLTGQNDLSSSNASHYMSFTSSVASAAQTDFANAYVHVTAAAPIAARQLGYLHESFEPEAIRSFSDLELLITPGSNQTHAMAMNQILEHAGNDVIQRMAAQQHHPVTILPPPNVSRVLADAVRMQAKTFIA